MSLKTKLPDPRSACPISGALDLLGDRWSLLIVRDMFLGATRYGDFAQSYEHIPTNILADRLNRLEGAGIIRSEPYQLHPRRYAYSLTPSGLRLKGVLGQLALWGHQHVAGTQMHPELREKLAK